MSTNIPFEIQEEIVKRVLDVKSLIRFRCVSNQWMSLIDSSEFITHHSLNQTHPHHLLVSFFDDSDDKYVSIDDDDSFPHHKYSHVASPTIQLPSFPSILDSSHGLVCLLASPSKTMLLVWNPLIRKSVGIMLDYEPHALGFGVCPRTFDVKIVKVTRSSKTRYHAEVFSLSCGVWRNISMKLSHKTVHFSNNVVVIDGLIHWVVTGSITNNDEKPYGYWIVSFDLTSEEFGEVDLPDCLAAGYRFLDISKLKESLVVLDYRRGCTACDVWMMLRNGVKKCLFTKLFTIKAPLCRIIGFRKNGQLIINKKNRLQVYEPGLEHMNDLGIHGSFFEMASYTESLLLLNHSDSIYSYQRRKRPQGD